MMILAQNHRIYNATLLLLVALFITINLTLVSSMHGLNYPLSPSPRSKSRKNTDGDENGNGHLPKIGPASGSSSMYSDDKIVAYAKHIENLFNGIVKNESNYLERHSPYAIMDELKIAESLHIRLNNILAQVPYFQREYVHKVKIMADVLKELAGIKLNEETGCTAESLHSRKELTEFYSGHSHLTNFFNHFNKIQYQICLNKLEAGISPIIENHAEFRDKMNLLKKYIMVYVLEGERESPNYLDIARGIMDYLSEHSDEAISMIDMGIAIHEHTSIDYYLRKFKILLRGEFGNSCKMIMPILRPLFNNIFVHLEPLGFIMEQITDEVGETMEDTLVCLMILEYPDAIYLLSRYNYDEMKYRLLENNIEETCRLEPREVAQQLEIVSRMMPYKEAFLDNMDEEMMDFVDGLLETKSIQVFNCRRRYFEHLNDIIEQTSGYVCISAYLKYYGQLQVQKCAPLFNRFMNEITNDVYLTSGRKQSINGLRRFLQATYDAADNLPDSMSPRVKLYSNTQSFKIPLFKLSIAIRELIGVRELIDVGVASNVFDDFYKETTQACDYMRRRVGSRKLYFEQMQIILGHSNEELEEKFFDQNTLDWMSNLNVCLVFLGGSSDENQRAQ